MQREQLLGEWVISKGRKDNVLSPWGMSRSLRVLLLMKSAYAIIKQMRATSVKLWKSTFKKKLMAYQALSTKVKHWWKTVKTKCSSQLLLQKQNKNEVKKIYINPGVKRSWAYWGVGSSVLRGGAVCQSFVCLRQVSLHKQKSCFISSRSRKQQTAVNR